MMGGIFTEGEDSERSHALNGIKESYRKKIRKGYVCGGAVEG